MSIPTCRLLPAPCSRNGHEGEHDGFDDLEHFFDSRARVSRALGSFVQFPYDMADR